MTNNNKPNLLIIQTDQQSWWTLSCYGGAVIKTPHIDALADKGVLFSNFFTNSAVCTPSRGCLVTGRYPTSHGAYTNNLPLNRDEITFAEVLKREGYKTGFVGKWHLDGYRKPGWIHPERGMGFDRVQYMFNRGHWKKIEDSKANKKDDPVVSPYSEIGDSETYTTDYLTNKTLAFLNEPSDEPFCFMLSLPDPHSPVTVRDPYNSLIDPSEIELPKTFNPTDLPDWAIEGQKSSQFGLNEENREEKLKKFLASYYGEVKLIDDSVGRIVQGLKDNGQYENTLIVFTTDHGEYAGEHGLQHKNLLYETAYRIPMIFHWPKGLEKSQKIEEIVSTVDFQPTILNLMGYSISGREEGCDASPLIRNEKLDWDNVSFLHHNTHNMAGIFTPEFELAFVKDGDAILFDRINDPLQEKNLFKESNYKETVEVLKNRIIEHHQSLKTPSISWLNSV